MKLSIDFSSSSSAPVFFDLGLYSSPPPSDSGAHYIKRDHTGEPHPVSSDTTAFKGSGMGTVMLRVESPGHQDTTAYLFFQYFETLS